MISVAKSTLLDYKQQTVVLQIHYQGHTNNQSEEGSLNFKNMIEMLELQFETDKLKLIVTQTTM